MHRNRSRQQKRDQTLLKCKHYSFSSYLTTQLDTQQVEAAQEHASERNVKRSTNSPYGLPHSKTIFSYKNPQKFHYKNLCMIWQSSPRYHSFRSFESKTTLQQINEEIWQKLHQSLFFSEHHLELCVSDFNWQKSLPV